MPRKPRSTDGAAGRDRYQAPEQISTIGLWDLLDGVRTVPASQRQRLALPGVGIPDQSGPTLHYAGDISLVRKKCVAVVGSRKVSPEGAARARRLARELAAAGIVVVSGLAEGVDTEAHSAAIAAGGKTIAVIGTGIDRVFPAKNGKLQEQIYREQLLITPFAPGTPVYKSNFPQRNKIMAAISDATVIVEATDESGSLHQAAECAPNRLNRWLLITRSLVEDPSVSWPKKFLGGPKVKVLERTEDILSIL